MTKKISREIEIGGRTLKLEVGDFAGQTNAAVWATYGQTAVLATVVASPHPTNLDYFPLDVEYMERLYAGGRIKGSRWVKREGRPTDEAILAGRLIDRSLRPLFPEGFLNEVQVTVTVLSVDGEDDPVVLASLASAAALSFSNIPFSGPMATVEVGMKEDTYFINPVAGDEEFSDLNLVISCTREKVVMIEAKGNQVEEKKVVAGIEFGFKEAQRLLDFIEAMRQEIGKEKMAYVSYASPELEKEISQKIKKDLEEAWEKARKGEELALSPIKEAVLESFAEEDKIKIRLAFEKAVKKWLRGKLLEGERPDGRKIDEIRPITAEVGVLPRTHGSAIFTRGKTQVLSIATLGPLSLEQWIESPEGEETKRYMHHYSMLPFASGEIAFISGPKRREIGHGALAEKALEPVLPGKDVFPYAIRVVSEVLSSDGSTSMASTCGSTLALMDAGVPIKEPVAGIALGMASKQEKWTILTDIAGIEDFNGEMDFKVTGTKNGVTAIQMDVKNEGLVLAAIDEALVRAKKAREEILAKMLAVLPQAREKVSQYAPKVALVKIDPEKIGGLIGPGGKIIRQIIEETGCEVNVEDNGEVSISGANGEEVNRAVNWVKNLTREVKAGEIFEGVVKRIRPFGAFVEILPQKEGLVHVSQMASHFVKDPAEVVSEGDKVQVKVREIDDQGRINLTMILDGSNQPQEYQERPRLSHFSSPRGRYERSGRGDASRRPRR